MISSNNRLVTSSKNGWSSIRRTPKFLIWTLLVGVVLVYCYFFYSNFVKPYSFRWKAIYGEMNYPDGEVWGIDVSHYQKNIDWQKLKHTKINDKYLSFAFIKATEGCEDCDSLFEINFRGAHQQRVIRGAYHFLTSQSSGIEQAKYFCKTVTLQKGDLPPVLDVEFDKDTQFNNNRFKLKTEILNWLLYTENYFRVKPIIYASYNFKTQFLQDKCFSQYPYWIAHYYVDSLSYEGNWSFWQHTDAGHVDGIDGYVDLNLFNGNAEDIENMCLK